MTDSTKMGAILVAAVMLSLVACGAAPKKDLDLEELRVDLEAAENDAQITRYAPSELQNARLAVRTLEQERSNDAEVRGHLAYMAERRIDIARARAAERYQRDRLLELEREHDRILLQASLEEAERARQEAEQLRRQSMARAEEAERALREAQAERERSEEIEQQAELAQEEAERARRLAEAQAKEAELARQEADLASAQADALRRQLQNLQARETDRGLVFTLGDLLFESGQADLKPESLANLDRLIGFIKEYPDRDVNIEGHTDSVGSAEFNLQLSQDRAEAVRRALIDRGVSPSRLKAIGLGEAFPVASNETPFGRRQNRRVEIIILGAGDVDEHS